MNSSQKRGKLLYQAASCVLIVTGLSYVPILFIKTPPRNDLERQLLNLMTNYRMHLPGALRSTAELVQGMNIAFIVFGIAFGVTNFVFAVQRVAPLKRLALLNTFWMAILLVNGMYNWFLVPNAFFGTALLLFAASWFVYPAVSE